MRSERDRDRAMDEPLRRTLRADARAEASEACLDPETLAAWMDDGLDAKAMALAEAHVAGCARCQAVASVMVQTAPAAPVPAGWWQRNWSLRWLFPFAAAAAAVVLWAIVPDQRQPVTPSLQDAGVRAPAEQPASPTVDALAPTQSPGASQPARRGEVEQTPAAKPQAAPESGALARKLLVAPPTAERESTPDAQAVESMAFRAEERVGAASPAPSAVAGAEAASPLPASPARPRPLQVGQERASLEIVSPDPTVRWRLGAHGAVEYSDNSGATWEALSTGIATELTAGSSPSPTVCWLVGRGGAILLTTDGRHWQRVPFTDAADLSSVVATDARTAIVTAADGRVFRTADAGQNWRRQTSFQD